MDTKTKEVYECPPSGKCYRLPMEEKTINRQEVKVAELAVQKEREERRADEMTCSAPRGAAQAQDAEGEMRHMRRE